MQWVYGRALRDGLGAVIAVVIVLDRQSRRATRRDHEAMAAAARRLVDTLADLPRSAGPKATSELTVDSYSPPAGIPNRKQHGLMLTNEVAQAFDVTRRTVINWAAAGKLPSTRTLGGHLRFRTDDILKLLG
jgi:excisionase family DNA binding protein